MKDGIPKGSGNSRFLKSVENFKTLYPTYDAFVAALVAGTLPIDLNGINAEGWEQIGDALGKYALLKDSTAEAMGLSAAALPDDALRILSRFHSGLGNEYLWAKNRKTIKAGSTSEIKPYSSTNSPSQSRLFYYTGTTITVTYGDSYAVDDNLAPYIVNPTTFSITNSTTADALNVLKGKWYISTWQPGVVFFVPASITFKLYTEGSSRFYLTQDVSVFGYSAFTTEYTFAGYVNSPNPNAYPPAVDDGFTYQAMGMLGEKVRIVAGSYIGTGTFGSANPNSLTFEREPKLIFIAGNAINTGNGFFISGGEYNGLSIFSSASILNTKFSGNTASWYTTASNGANIQLNVSGVTYNYIGII